MTEQIEVIVVGAGVVGLAIARALSLRGHEVVVLERHPQPGTETTSRNSGVIHSGIYYPTGSLKARLCVAGRLALYEYCHERGIRHHRCGKLIVAQEGQQARLQALHRQAIANGVRDLAPLNPDAVRTLEPEVRCAAGLLCPSTGIIDVHELLTSFQGDLESGGGTLVCGTHFRSARRDNRELIVQIDSGGMQAHYRCRWLINSAGLEALPLLRLIEGYPSDRHGRAWFAKGNYFSCQGRRPFRHLVYPMPNDAGLGIHATLDLDGSTRFGPDVQWVSDPEYSVDPARAETFYAAIREYWPDLPDGALQPAYAGVRPKRVGPGIKPADFLIEGPAEHGVAGLVNLLGIESPGVTSAMAIAQEVAELVSAEPDHAGG